MLETPIRVLAVDDRPDNLFAIQATLRSSDYEVVTASSGRDALRYLLENDCALILLDVQMPDMDGFETAHLIHQSPRSRNTPIIFLTAISKEREFVGRGYASGAVDYLFKPFDPEILKAKVGVFAALHRSRQEILALQQAEQLRVRAELELKSARRVQALQKKYQDLVNGISHAVIWSADPESLTIRYVSPSTRELLAIPPEQWGEPGFFVDHLLHDERDHVLAQLQQVTRDTEPHVFEHRFLKGDGTVAWLQSSVRASDASSDRLELHGLSVDLTPQKRAELALSTIAEASHELLVSLEVEETLNRFLDVLVPRLGDWCFVELGPRVHGRAQAPWSWAMARLLGATKPDEAAHPAPADALPPDAEAIPPGSTATLRVHLGVEDEHLLQQIARDETQLRALRDLAPRSLLSVPLASGAHFFGRMVLGYSRPDAKHDDAAVLLAEELGRRATQALDNARLYRDVQESVRVREDFMSIASHELRTPLTSLRLHLSALERILDRNGVPVSVAEEAGPKVGSIRRQSERLIRLVESLLDVARIRTGKLELELEELQLGTLVREVLGRFRDDFTREGIAVHLEVGEDLGGHWDRSRLDQVLTNLISNAVKYGGGRPIDIVAESRGDNVVVSVQDRGIGIEGPNPERVFRRFERANGARSFSGLGLGLYIVQQLVEAHGGSVRVQTQVGLGSTFTVELPKRLALEIVPSKGLTG